MALGSTWNPVIEKLYRIQPPYNMLNNAKRGAIQVESWVAKEEIEYPNDMFGEGRGFTVSLNQPKRFSTGRRFDLEQQAKQR